MKVPVGAKLVYDFDFAGVKGVFPPESPDRDHHWVSGNEETASTTIQGNRMEVSVWDVPVHGKVGGRGSLTNDGRWDVVSDREGKHDLITWKTLIPRLIPVAQGPNRFCMMLDGKMGLNGSDGIWGVNMEVTNGAMRHWVQNQTGKGVYHSAKTANAIPVNVEYECALEVLWKTDLTGFMEFRYLDTVIRADNVQMLGKDKLQAIMWSLYVGDDGGVLPDNSRYTVQYSGVQLWELPAIA